MAFTSFSVLRSVDLKESSDSLEDMYIHMSQETTKEVTSPLKCYGRIYDPSFLLSEIFIPEHILSNRKLNADKNEDKPHAFHILQKQEFTSFSTYIEEDNKASEEEIYLSDSDNEFSDTAYNSSNDCEINSSPTPSAEKDLVLNYHLENESEAFAKSSNCDFSFHTTINDANVDESVGCTENVNDISDDVLSCFEFSSQGANENRSQTESFSTSENASLVNDNDTTQNKIKVSSNYLEQKIESEPLENTKLKSNSENNDYDKKEFYVLTKSKKNDQKKSKYPRYKKTQTAPVGYNYCNLDCDDEAFEDYMAQCRDEAAEKFRMHALGFNPSNEDQNLHHNNVHKFPKLPEENSMISNSTKKVVESHDYPQPELTLKSIGTFLEGNKDTENQSISMWKKEEIPLNNALSAENDILIIENIPSNISCMELENWLNGYGKIHRFSLIPSGKMLKAELEIDCDLEWIADSLNGTQAFGACSSDLKCHILNKSMNRKHTLQPTRRY